MNNEIKEILDFLKDEDEYYKKAEEVIVGYGDLIVEKEDIDKLLDYITNLRQENEMMRKLIDEGVENSYKKLKDLQQENERLKEANKILEENWKHYMMICGKAIEYINNNEILNTWGYYKPFKEFGYGKDLLNILQNGSDSQ